MLIDWFTVFAQIVNFLILVVLLRIFLYGRIVKAMKKREKTIADKFEEADSQREKAEQTAKELAAQKDELDAKADELLKQARQEAARQKEELVLKARQEVDSQKDAWQEALAQDREAFLRELSELVSAQLTEICKKTLADLADENLVDRLAQSFAKRVENLSPDEAAPLKKALAGSNETPLVQSSLELSKEAQEAVIHALKNSLGIEADPRFERDDTLVLGIALYCKGKRIALSAQDYLNNLLEKAGQRIIEETGQGIDQKPPEKEG